MTAAARTEVVRCTSMEGDEAGLLRIELRSIGYR